MTHGYRTIQHWNQWLTQHFLGHQLIEAETATMSALLSRHFGKQALLIGVPHQSSLLHATKIPCHSLLTSFIGHKNEPGLIEGDYHELPILTGSIDLVMLPHTLEFVDNPRQLLAEACRIVKPEGLLVICGFNPYSIWGLRKYIKKQRKTIPWGLNFIHSHQIKRWLQLADFALEKNESLMFRPPVNHPTLYQRFHFMETVGSKCFPFLGGVYILVARATVAPLTPIRLKWKQQLSGIRISSTIPGNIARYSNRLSK